MIVVKIYFSFPLLFFLLPKLCNTVIILRGHLASMRTLSFMIPLKVTAARPTLLAASYWGLICNNDVTVTGTVK